MTSDQAQTIASEFVKGHDERLVFAGVHRDPRDADLWTAVFQIPGLDGPLIVVVSDSTGNAEFFDNWFQRTR